MTTPRGQTRHRRRYDGLGHARLLTFSCFQRRPFLRAVRTRDWFLHALASAKQRHAVHVWACVVMPEHVHLLVFPTDRDVRIGAFLASLKTPIARKAAAWVRAHAPSAAEAMTQTHPGGQSVFRFWQRGGGYDQNLWSEKHIWHAIDYIHLNPVRRGLCGSLYEWPMSTARAHRGDADAVLEFDRQYLPGRPSS